MGRPRKIVQVQESKPSDRMDALALRIRDKLQGMVERNVERFLENMDAILDGPPVMVGGPAIHHDPETLKRAARVLAPPREMPQAARSTPALGSGQRITRKCRNCRQPGHRAPTCPNPKVEDDGSSDEDPDGEQGPRARAGASVSTRPKVIVWDEQLRLIKLVQETGDRRALDHLVRSNLGLVHRVAHQCPWHSMPYDDVVQEGLIGLVKGIEKFDVTRGMRLSTYATWWIRHYIIRAHENNGMIRVPVHSQVKMMAITKARKMLESQLGREATDEELAEAANLDLRTVQKLAVRGRVTSSLDVMLMSEDGERQLHDILEDHTNVRADDEMVSAETKMLFEQALAQLPEREARIIQLRYLDGEGMTLAEVGAMIAPESNTGRDGLSRERIRQMERVAIKQLKHKLRRQLKAA